MIAKWQMKAVLQKGISYLPQKEKINYWFQKNVTKGVNLSDEYFGYKINHASDHLRFFKKYAAKNIKDCIVLELGTGWYPIIPIAFFLNDLEQINSIDISDWMTNENIMITCQKFLEWRNEDKLDRYLNYINESKWKTIEELSKQNGLELDKMCEMIYLKRWVGDARKTDFKNNSIDLICSNNTFEHIPEETLINILKEFKRINKNDGVMSHFIDLSDHFAHFDKSINIYNFLKYSDQRWKMIDNSIQPQNRLRFKDYKKIYGKLQIPVSYEEVRKGNLEEVKKIDLDSNFHDYTLEEIAISHGYIISQVK